MTRLESQVLAEMRRRKRAKCRYVFGYEGDPNVEALYSLEEQGLVKVTQIRMSKSTGVTLYKVRPIGYHEITAFGQQFEVVLDGD